MCLHLKNKMAGFRAQHSVVFCGRPNCEAPPTHHVSVGYSCLNVCAPCADKMRNRSGKVEVTALEKVKA